MFSFQSETEYNEWLKEIRKSHEEAQVMVRTGAKIMASGTKTFNSQVSKDSGDFDSCTPLMNHAS